MSAYWPVVQARLVALLPGLTGLAPEVVFDGPSVSREKGVQQYVTVGATTDSGGGSYEQPDSTLSGNIRTERGDVEIEMTAWSGDTTDLPAKRTVVFGWANALEAAIRTDQRLGVLPDGSTTSLAGELVAAENPGAVRLVVTVSYFVPVAA